MLVLGLGGGAAWYFLHGSAMPSAAEPPRRNTAARMPRRKKSKKEAPPEYLAIEPFTVNLQPDNGDQYLQIAFTLQVDGAEQAEAHQDEHGQGAQPRAAALVRQEGVRDQHGAKASSSWPAKSWPWSTQPFAEHGDEQEVSDVLFTSFIIQ